MVAEPSGDRVVAEPSGDRVVAVLPDVPALGRAFDYSVPAKWHDSVRLGSKVRVALHGRRVGGWVVADPGDPPESVRLQPLSGVSGWGPPPGVIEVARWAAWRWAGPVTAFLRAGSPPHNVHVLPPPAAWPNAGPEPVVGPRDGSASGVGAGVLLEALARVDRPTLLRVAPEVDLLPMVEEVVRWARPARRGPSDPPGTSPPPGGPGSGTVLVLVPNVGWAERLSARLRRRRIPVAASWEEAASGWPVVVGARSAAWSPVARVVAVIVLDAHDEAYRDERAPTANAWQVVAERARRDGAPCLLVSPCPSVVQIDQSVLRVGPRALERAGWPALVVLDRRGADPREGLLSGPLVSAAQEVLGQGGRIVCVLNRTGRARLLACAACGELVRCEHCGHALHQRDELLSCPACGTERPVVCAGCGATRLRLLRPGVARVREELEALLRVQVTEVSGPEPAPSGRRPGALEDRSGLGAARAFVGTEAVLHRVRQADLVAFLDFDQHLLAPRFAGAEESLALIARAGRLVGGRGRGTTRGAVGRVVVQTRLPDHEVLRAAVEGDPGILASHELALRRQLSLPPVGALALLSGASAAVFAAGLRELSLVEVSDLDEGRWMVRAGSTAQLCDALAAVPRPPGRLRVEVDPTAL